MRPLRSSRTAVEVDERYQFIVGISAKNRDQCIFLNGCYDMLWLCLTFYLVLTTTLLVIRIDHEDNSYVFFFFLCDMLGNHVSTSGDMMGINDHRNFSEAPSTDSPSTMDPRLFEYILLYIYMQITICIYIYIYMYACMYVSMYVCIYIYMYTQMYNIISIYNIYIYTCDTNNYILRILCGYIYSDTSI